MNYVVNYSIRADFSDMLFFSFANCILEFNLKTFSPSIFIEISGNVFGNDFYEIRMRKLSCVVSRLGRWY